MNEKLPNADKNKNRIYGKTKEMVSDLANNDAIDSIAEGDITVTGISESDERERMKENTSPRGAKYNLRPNLTPTTLTNTESNTKN